MKNLNYFNLNQIKSNPDGQTTVKRQSRLMLQSGCSAVDVPMTSYGASDEHPISIRSASDGTRWNSRGWKYVAMIFAVLILSVANIGMAWGAETSMPTSGSYSTNTKYAFSNSAVTGGNFYLAQRSSISKSSNYGWRPYNTGIALQVSSPVSLTFTIKSNTTSSRTITGQAYAVTDPFFNIYKNTTAGSQTLENYVIAVNAKSAGSRSSEEAAIAAVSAFAAITSSVDANKKLLICETGAFSEAVAHGAAISHACPTTKGATNTFTVNLSAAGKYVIYLTSSNGDVGITKINIVPRKTIYMVPGNWNGDTPKFFVHSWGDFNDDVLMTLANCETNVFKADIPTNNTNLLFTRQTPSSTEIKYKDQDGNWNQSANYSIGSNNQFTFSGTWSDGEGKSTFNAGTYSAPTFTVTYDANGGTGSVPVDGSSPYSCGSNVTILGNTGSLAKAGKAFDGWNTASGGGGTSYTEGSILSNITGDVTLFAKWVTAYSVTYNANGGSGSVPSDATPYVNGATVTVLGRNTLTKSDYVFAGWNTKSDGSGTWYIPTETFSMGTKNVTLYAQWATCISTTDFAALSDAMGTRSLDNTKSSLTSNNIKHSLGGDTRYDNSSGYHGLKLKHTGDWIGFGVAAGNTVTIKTETVGASPEVTIDFESAATLPANTDKAYEESGSARYFRIKSTDGSKAVVINKITIGTASCTAPTGLSAGSLTAKGATFTVTDGANTNNYEFYVSKSSTAPTAETAATYTSTEKTKAVTDLVAGTKYYAWVRSKCSASNKSDWVSGGNFTTSTVTVTHTLTNVSKTSGGETAGGSDYTAVYAADAEYSMPTPTVTIDGNTATSGTDYTWSSGTLTIPANKINGNIVITLNSVPSAPTSATISGTYHYFPGENISLTVTPTGNNGPTTYQWYKGGKADGNRIDGATSATYTKNSCTFDDAGSYYCKVTCNATSIWANTNSSENYDVKILRLYVNGSKSGDPYGNVDFVKVDGTTATASISLGSGWTYGFNIADGCGHYYGNAGIMTENNCTNWVTNVNGTDCGLTTTNAATYIFTINYSNLSMITTSVTYPSANQASGKVIYFDNNVLKWTGSSIYYRIGHSSHSQADQLSLVPGTANLYKMTTREYNSFSAWQIGNAEGGNGSDKSIYNTKNTPAITASIAYEGGAVTADAVTVTPGVDHSTGGDAQNNNCEFYSKTITNGMKTDRVTISDYSNGTITVNYTNTSNVASTLTSAYADLAHTVILTSITTSPNEGYDAGAITINGGAYSANYVVTGATTIAATFSPQVYSITYKDQGNVAFSGSHADGYPTTHTYGSSTTLKTASKTGYTFGGWYGNPECTGVAMTSIGATSITAGIILYAKWTAAASLTAISADSLYQAASMANITFTSSDQDFTGLSTNNLFKAYGNTTGDKSTTTAAFGKNETISDITDDISTKSFSSALYITAADNISSTSDPTKGAIEFITPSTAGLLYLYFPNTSSGLTLKKKGASSSTSLNGAKYKAMTVDANTHYFINGSGSNRGLYAIKYVSTYSATHTLSHVTATSGATGAGKVVKGKAYEAVFAAEGGYTLPSDVTVTIGGAAATKGTDYTWNSSTGAFTVLAAKTTGAVVVTVTGVAPIGYTVTYQYNGATGGAGTASETGTSVTLPTPTRTDYTFDGWYTTEGTKVGNGGATYNPTADITLYARWEEECDAGGVAKSTTDVAATGYTAYQEKGGSNVVFTSAPSLGFKYKDADGNTINSSTTAVVRNNAYSCQIKSDSGNKGSIKTNSTFSNVDSISFYFAASDKSGCKIAVWCSTDNFSTDSTSLLSATTYASNNSEFKLKTLAIPAAKKTSALTFKFRFTVTGAGKICYMDSLKVYSSTTGGSTCYHVYYHGNGAESGYVNDTVSYTAGSKATVLNYNYGRYPLAKAGYDFQGWATSAGGAVAYTAGQKIDITSADVDLYAKWATASSALVTWEKKVNVATWTDNTTPSTTNPTYIGTIGSSATLIASPSSTSGKTPQIQLASGVSNADKGASFTFSMKSADKVVVPTKVSCEVANVGGESNSDITYKAVLTDGAGNTYYSTNSICPNNNGTLNPIDFVFSSGLSLRGDITIKVYAWLSGSGSGFSFRMGPDVKFYGTVENYECATPAAPTISGVSEYVPGQTITLTASHEGTNHDNLTTYTWYRGADWATASSNTPVQTADTGESGYTLTIADCTTGDAGLYWCEVSNGTGCDAHNSEGYNIIVYPTYTITYNLNGGAWGEVVHKDSYTQFDEDYTLPIPSKDGYVFAGWYEASDFSGVTVTVLGSGAIGDKNYYAKWGTAVTVSWTVTKVDSKLYRGGGGYSVKAVINETDWNTGFMDELELTATEGVTLKNIEVSENDEDKVQVTADFDITTDLAADATEISFTLNVPADGTYGPKVDEHEEDLTDCGGGASGYTEFFSMIPKANTCSITNTTAYNASNHYTTCECTSSATITTGGSVTFGLYSSGTGTTDKFWEYNSKNGGWKHSIANSWVVLYSTDQFKAGDSIVITNGNTSSSGYYTIVAAASNNTADYHSASQVAAPSTTSPAKNTNYYYKLPVSFVSSNYLVIRSSTSSSCYVGTIKAYHAAAKGGETPTLTWDDGDEDIATTGIAKNTSDNDFIYTASQDKNSLGAITYSSNDVTVATVNATTGQVHLVGAAGTATITATIAASGCFSSANVSYTITVTDDCDDVAGTITTEDLGCSGIQMTITGHTAAAGVSYQWYKDDVSLGSADGAQTATYTTTAAGEYYVIVTNSGDRHCAKRSTNTITVEAQAAVTATKIVDSWYVKNGRRTPDIELVKTTNATSFTVTSGLITIWESAGSTKTGFGGCGFHMDENGIIYLNGTKDDDGSATTGLTAGDETLTITAIGCGSNASQTITIHKQAATDYKEIAFVVDGEKGKDFDQVTSGHAAGTELYTYLDSVGTAAEDRLFKLTQQNIYSTTDEKAIRQHYSQFDGILITDDPSTNTTPEGDYKTKGYVNAFGTMVDVRPIFTMEAYVSALKNWGSKGIAGNPQSPNPRQYEMRLECKDHEIYGAGLPDPEDGTNVWEEVIDGETFRHVIIVDSTKGVYNGVAYNAETAGNQKPALQGFTGEAAGSLLGLGRILEGTLQAAIERQEEPAARLLVMGINAKALQPTCALTNEGKAVIKNILVYLLKTNMEEVDDCSNYFTGGASGTDTDWNKASNWSKNALPSNEAKVRILAPCVVKNGNTFHVAQVDIATSGPSSKKGSGAANGNLTIEAGGALIVAGKIRAAEAPYFAANDLKPTTPEDLIINTDGSAQAALIFDNEEGETQATVEYYSLGRKDGSAYQFQYFASPMGYLEINPAFAGAGIYTYAWDETIQDGWERRGYYTDVFGFEGLAITTKRDNNSTYTLKGALASTADVDIPLTYTDAGARGQNLIGNSWTAPINIASLVEAFDDDDNVEKTVRIYNSGNDNYQVGTAGTWTSVPIDISGWPEWTGLKVIPAMQAFRIDVTSETQLSLNYKTMVRQTPSDKLNEPLKAPTRRSNANRASLMRMRLESGMAHTDLFLIEGGQFSEAFDNGYEAKFIAGEDNTVQFYAMNGEEKMAVLATDALEGTPVGFVPGKGTAYTISFSGDGMGYYLNDVKKQTSTLISEENTYSFDYEAGDDANRFYISATPFSMPQITTGMENLDAVAPKVQKVIYNDKMYIIRGGKVFSADGQLVK